MAKQDAPNPMSKEAAARIQSASDRAGRADGFKERAARAAEANVKATRKSSK